MRTVILKTSVKLLTPLFILFSLFLLFRGHNAAGGGFIGGLLAAIGLFMRAMVLGVNNTIAKYRIRPMGIIAIGLTIALISLIIPLLLGHPLMTGVWLKFSVPLIGKLGTPLMFDIGVYALVIGVVLNITFILSKN
ncbi:MAG: multicomponent Na+:H+ antiporter subunit [Tenuifilum sp.]|jgi:multicomponent Na+:H+ antiporter subunit B|uniref:Na(+)/H(+) antiporter subunit B n=1 Tax=Tenuifilum thalassicum TaxID=2590900 RepID=A0A7D4BDY7_9BACT|nr:MULTISPECIES: MnhB domain-containing protein [Tenuifilum]MDI3526767.1 multicomponent Na+:H+ antiporter subunit [Tenuifilum sp.]QKG79658.1 Na(+)/H(+) antiporter subunit B [Tenuifilum thalassicum]